MEAGEKVRGYLAATSDAAGLDVQRVADGEELERDRVEAELDVADEERRRGCVNMCSRKTPAKPESAAAAHAASTPTTGSGSAGTLKSASVRPASTASSPSGAPSGCRPPRETDEHDAHDQRDEGAPVQRGEPAAQQEHGEEAAQSSFVWTSTIDVTAGRLVSAT